MAKLFDEETTNNFGLSMNRIHIIHALAECVKMDDIVETIENQGGDIITENELVRIEKLVLKRILDLRSNEDWPLFTP